MLGPAVRFGPLVYNRNPKILIQTNIKILVTLKINVTLCAWYCGTYFVWYRKIQRKQLRPNSTNKTILFVHIWTILCMKIRPDRSLIFLLFVLGAAHPTRGRSPSDRALPQQRWEDVLNLVGISKTLILADRHCHCVCGRYLLVDRSIPWVLVVSFGRLICKRLTCLVGIQFLKLVPCRIFPAAPTLFSTRLAAHESR